LLQKIFIACEPSCLHKFQKGKKNIQHLQINIALAKKISFEKKNRVVKTGSDSKTISIPIMSKILCLS
jgi:hypothetical protein